MNKKLLKLENNKEYFMINELEDNGIKYLLLMNVDNEYDIKIVKKVTIDEEDYIIDVKQNDIILSLKDKFKALVDSDKNIYS